mmetsp:Transcript_4264/g.7256  ORF Transcript_4264/g.7256 Transcript_4264/m.7256 type:complete len:111 (+) Transcript_4264:147-479(+)
MFGLCLRRLALLLFVVLCHFAAVASRPLEGRQLLGDEKEEKKNDKDKSGDSLSNKEKSLNARIGKYESKSKSGSKEDKKEYDNKISDMNKRLKSLKSKQENRHSKSSKKE